MSKSLKSIVVVNNWCLPDFVLPRKHQCLKDIMWLSTTMEISRFHYAAARKRKRKKKEKNALNFLHLFLFYFSICVFYFFVFIFLTPRVLTLTLATQIANTYNLLYAYHRKHYLWYSVLIIYNCIVLLNYYNCLQLSWYHCTCKSVLHLLVIIVKCCIVGRYRVLL